MRISPGYSSRKPRVPRDWPARSSTSSCCLRCCTFLAPQDIATVADRAVAGSNQRALFCWSTGAVAPATLARAMRAAELFIERSRSWLRPAAQHHEPRYRLDLLRRVNQPWTISRHLRKLREDQQLPGDRSRTGNGWPPFRRACRIRRDRSARDGGSVSHWLPVSGLLGTYRVGSWSTPWWRACRLL